MGLRCLTYGDLWGCCGCGVEPIGIYGGAVAAVWDLWGSMGVLWLRCGTYGDLWGCCACGLRPMGLWQFRYLCIGLRCQTYGADLWGKAIAISMWDLWGPMGDLWGTYGGPMGDLWGRMGDLWGIYGGVWGIYAGLMGNLWGYKLLVWDWSCFMYGIAAFDL